MTHQAEPSPAPNAAVVYFSAYDTRCSQDFYCLHRSGRDGSAPELLGTLIAPNQVTWRPSSSPDGSRVAFVTTGTVIKVFDYASKSVLPWGIAGQHPSWSPDSRWLLAKSNTGTLDLIEVDTGNVLPLGFTTSYQSGSLK